MNIPRTDLLRLLPALPFRNDSESMTLTQDEIDRIGMMRHRSYKVAETIEIDATDAALLARFNRVEPSELVTGWDEC